MEIKLKKLRKFRGRKGPLLLVIMDGIGLGSEDETNAVFMANTPVLDNLLKMKLRTKLKAHGPAVGLPSNDDMGNSEVGHNAIGAGRIFAQGAKLVNSAFDTGNIFESPVWKQVIKRGNEGKTVHFIGLLSDGNVHSHIKHLFLLIDNCTKNLIKRVRIHTLLDGRDVGERSAPDYIDQLENLISEINKMDGFDYRVASGGGRMVTTMDRYNADWRIVKKGWDAHVLGRGRKFASAKEAVSTYYNEDPAITDQYLDSFVITDKSGEPLGKILDGDAVVFYNFRGDRAIEISKAFEEEDFKEFEREYIPDVLYAGMMEYDGDLHIPRNYLVTPPAIDHTISEYLCAEGVKMFAISETQKYGHVTYFWNGNRSGYINRELEKYIEIPSDKIQFDKAPKMKAFEITEAAIKLIESGEYRFGRINYPNGDMVGHTGVMAAAVTAVETVDACLQNVLDIIDKTEGVAIITADHGNADEMFTVKKGKKEPKTAHTLNPVPFIIYDTGYNNEYKMADIQNPGLTNIAATILNLLGYEKPEEYDKSLISFNE